MSSRIWEPGVSISASQLFSWSRCSASFWFERVLRVPAPGRSFLLLGGALHKMGERMLTLKMEKLPEMSEKEVAGATEREMETRLSIAEGVKLSKDETKETLIEDAVVMALLYQREVLPQIDPFAIELLIGPDDGLRLPGSGTPVKAILDVIDQNAYVRDLKSGKAKWPEGIAENRLQTSVYQWAYRVRYGVPPPGMIYDLIIRKKRVKGRPHAAAEYQQVKCIPDPMLEFGVLRRMEVVIQQIRAEQYFPNHSKDCGDCPFGVEDFCSKHFAELPFDPCAEHAVTAPNPPRYIEVAQLTDSSTVAHSRGRRAEPAPAAAGQPADGRDRGVCGDVMSSHLAA